MPTSLPLRRALAITAAFIAIPIALAGCGAPAPVEDTATATPAPTTVPEKDEDDGVAAGFVNIFDDSVVLSVQVPETWVEVDGSPVTTATGVQLFNVIASPDLNGYNTTWSTPGVTFGATQDLSMAPEDYLVNVVTSVGAECGDAESDVYDDGVYSGSYVYLPDCGGVGTEFLAVAAYDSTQTHIVVVQMQMVSEQDKTTIRDQILSTFLALF